MWITVPVKCIQYFPIVGHGVAGSVYRVLDNSDAISTANWLRAEVTQGRCIVGMSSAAFVIFCKTHALNAQDLAANL